MLIFVLMELNILFRVCEEWKFQSAREVVLGHVLSSCEEVSVAFKPHLKIMEIRPSRRRSTSSRPLWPSSVFCRDPRYVFCLVIFQS